MASGRRVPRVSSTDGQLVLVIRARSLLVAGLGTVACFAACSGPNQSAGIDETGPIPAELEAAGFEVPTGDQHILTPATK